MSAKELERQKQQKINNDFKLYDAILASKASPVPSAPEVDEEMEKFQSLLQDYLQGKLSLHCSCHTSLFLMPSRSS